MSELLQLGGSVAYRYQSANSASDSAFQGLAGPTFNFSLGDGQDGIRSAFFISPMIGITTGETTFNSVLINQAAQFTMALSVGKRFTLTQCFSFAPAVGVVKELNFDPNFTVQPIAFSMFF